MGTFSLLFALSGQAKETTTLKRDKKTVSTPLSSSAKVKNSSVASGSNNAVLTNLVGGGSGFRFIGAFNHTPKLRNDQEDTSDILLRADYTVNKKHRFRVQQFYTKFYGKYHSENEFRATDTNFSHFYTPNFKPFGTRLMWRTAAVLPISHASKRDDLVTRVTGSLIGSKSFLNRKLLVFLVPYARYHWFQYKTSVSGRRLPWYTLGSSVTGIYFFTPKLSASLSANYNFEARRSSQFEISPDETLDNGTYRFDADVSYQFTPQVSASLSYFQGARYMEAGRYEMVFFDDENSRVGLGLTYIY